MNYIIPSPQEPGMPDAPTSRTTEIFCASCPSVEQVKARLRALRCYLQRTIRPGTVVAPQHHFEAAYGVTVIFLAGYDAASDVTGRAPLPHAARFWVSGNTHPRSVEIQHQVCEALHGLVEGKIIETASLRQWAKGA